jgi:hypothetical protein
MARIVSILAVSLCAAVLHLAVVKAATEGWGALAVSPDAWGWVKGYKSEKDAEEEALKQCRSRTKRGNCEVKSFESGCAAVVSYNYEKGGERLWGTVGHFGPTTQEAANRALANCQKEHSGCKVEYQFCN